jgi:hypothetical protein
MITVLQVAYSSVVVSQAKFKIVCRLHTLNLTTRKSQHLKEHKRATDSLFPGILTLKGKVTNYSDPLFDLNFFKLEKNVDVAQFCTQCDIATMKNGNLQLAKRNLISGVRCNRRRKEPKCLML